MDCESVSLRVVMIVVKARLNTHTGQEFLFYSITINNHHNEPKQRAGKCGSWVTLPLSHSSLTLLWFHEVKPAPQGSANLPVPSVANVLALVLISFQKPIDCTKITSSTGTFLFCHIYLYHHQLVTHFRLYFGVYPEILEGYYQYPRVLTIKYSNEPTL
mgnify:CR=1 FL=1